MSDAPEALRAPEPLNDTHRIDTFASGAPTLDGWLQRKARVNQLSGASRTYLICRGEQVVGFYALAAGSISHDHLPRAAAGRCFARLCCGLRSWHSGNSASCSE